MVRRTKIPANPPVKQKTLKELEKELGLKLSTFLKDKTYSDASPLQYTNHVVATELGKQKTEEELKAFFGDRFEEYTDEEMRHPKIYTGVAVNMYFNNKPLYRTYMEKAGFKYLEL